MRKRLNFLQIARCLAAVMVVMHHADRILLQKYQISALIFQPFDYPFARVDLFFVLSGFIIYYIHNQDFSTQSKLSPFLIKRFVRVIPVYWLATLIYILLSIVAHEHFTALEFVKSFLLLPDVKQPILGVAWTLRYEVFLYLVFGLLILNKRWFMPLLGVWTAAMLYFLAAGITFAEQPYFDLLFNPLNLEFIAGCVAAHIILRYMMNLTVVGYVGLGLLLVSLIMQQLWTIPLNHIILWGGPFFLIILGFASYELRKTIKVNKWLVAIGDASYSIFLTHIIVILCFRNVSDKLHLYVKTGHPIFLAVFVCIIAVCVGCAFYKVVEKPVLHWLRKHVVDRTLQSQSKRRIAVPSENQSV
ncbi:acyltransferase [Paenibacillus sp. R14(2021)]|uniref:acyltransferase family protein n=1 Tax=Paenibacillus sp. R14(2021) TaxID=2859228 RepID=UPI001C6136C5|nr:acyltransferase [Paenibacillus sp. R14(2021)]